MRNGRFDVFNLYLFADSSRPWRSSLPDVRRDDTDELLEEAEMFVRRSIDNLQAPSVDCKFCAMMLLIVAK